MHTVYLMFSIMCGNAALYSTDQFIIIRSLESTNSSNEILQNDTQLKTPEGLIISLVESFFST